MGRRDQVGSTAKWCLFRGGSVAHEMCAALSFCSLHLKVACVHVRAMLFLVVKHAGMAVLTRGLDSPTAFEGRPPSFSRRFLAPCSIVTTPLSTVIICFEWSSLLSLLEMNYPRVTSPRRSTTKRFPSFIAAVATRAQQFFFYSRPSLSTSLAFEATDRRPFRPPRCISACGSGLSVCLSFASLFPFV